MDTQISQTSSSTNQLPLTELLRNSKKELNSQWAFALFSFWCTLKKVANGTVLMLIVIVLMLTFPLTMVAIGIINLHECPADVYIPVFILGWGVVAAIKLLLSLRVQYIVIRSRRRSVGERGTLTLISNFFRDVETRELSHILSAAVLAASVGLGIMTYRTYGYWTPLKGVKTYCNPTFYYFAFYSTTVILCLSFLSVCIIYPFTGAIVYKLITVYEDISDVVKYEEGTQHV